MCLSVFSIIKETDLRLYFYFFFLPYFMNNFFNVPRGELDQSPLKEFVHSAAIFAMPPGSYFGHPRPSTIYLNWGILKSS